MELELLPLVREYGQLGFWGVVGLALFRYLLTRQDSLARSNLKELRKQLRDWQRRALRAELMLRAASTAGLVIPHEAVKEELELHADLDHLFPEYQDSVSTSERRKSERLHGE